MDTSHAQRSRKTDSQFLATDLDGTLIPLDGDPRNRADLVVLASHVARENVTLVYITGRHFQSAVQAMRQFQLPRPQWLICDVGTSIFKCGKSGKFEPVEVYQQHQNQIIESLPIRDLKQELSSIENLRLQEEEKQGPFKLSYYADAPLLDELVERIQHRLELRGSPYSIIHSVDPFNGDGLIDVLPATVSKAHALAWWMEHVGLNPRGIVFAGDSGNDLAAMTAGYRTIVVANADRAIACQAFQTHRESGWTNRLYLARGQATSGVLEGCRWFGLFPAEHSHVDRLGATPLTHDETRFRVWAPHLQSVEVALNADPDADPAESRHALKPQRDGYFVGDIRDARPGSRYQYVLDGQRARPDPASHSQPEGVHGPSQVIDHGAFPWTDQTYGGVAKRDLILYELHVGTFTQEGTFQAAIERLPELMKLGITAVEVMPVAQSPGRWNWGYDGVDLYAVRNTYGTPDDFKAFVDACHQLGIAVILDVVYNHVGPEGNYLAEFGPYFSSKHHTPWGEAFRLDEADSQPVRRFIVDNAIFWLEQYHLDGLRLDAAYFIRDDSEFPLLDEIRRAVTRYSENVGRTLHLIAETNVYDHALLTDRDRRASYDAIWCDCLMHSIYTLAIPDLRLTQRPYRGADDLAESLRYGYLYAGPEMNRATRSQGESPPRNNPESPKVASLVIGLQTHDSVGNHPHGKRIHHLTSKSFQKAAAGLTLLYPGIPLLFMGEEYAVDAPFPFFVDFEDPTLREGVDQGRAQEFPHGTWGDVLSPIDAEAFYNAKCHQADDLDLDVFAWYQQLIKLRKQGIAQGWLTAECLTVGHDPNSDLFSLQYECGAEGSIVVLARLTNPETSSAESVQVRLEGPLLLSSELNPEIDNGHVVLGSNHAVISKSPA